MIELRSTQILVNRHARTHIISLQSYVVRRCGKNIWNGIGEANSVTIHMSSEFYSTRWITWRYYTGEQMHLSIYLSICRVAQYQNQNGIMAHVKHTNCKSNKIEWLCRTLSLSLSRSFTSVSLFRCLFFFYLRENYRNTIATTRND